ncbi:MAG: Ubiquinone biosynthesis O-methyltransferase [bacterium]|nr:Ubiquinone biosynthesis O-methyltransferase [bacterium]
MALGGSGRYNKYLYLLREEALERALSRHRAELRGEQVLDVGCGSGYWADFFQRKGVREYTGIDVSQVAISLVSQRFPHYRFYQGDLGEDFPLRDRFDLVTAFDVLYHITDDSKFEQALMNLSRLCAPNALVVITDYFDDRQTISAAHVKHRSLETYRESLSRHGFEVLSIAPVFYHLGRVVGLTVKDMNHSWMTNFLLAPFYFRGWFTFVLYHLDRLVLPKVDPLSPRAKTKLVLAKRRPN